MTAAEWQLIVAGFAGGSIYAFNNRKALGAPGIIAAIVAGVSCSYVGADLASSYLSLVVSSFLTALAKGVPIEIKVPVLLAGFVCGLFGQIIVTTLMKWAQARANQLVKHTPKNDGDAT